MARECLAMSGGIPSYLIPLNPSYLVYIGQDHKLRLLTQHPTPAAHWNDDGYKIY